MTKQELRKTMLEKRMAMPADERARACGYLCDELLRITLPERPVIAGYSPIRGEVDIIPALKTYALCNKEVCLPTISKPELILRFLEWHPEAETSMGHFGITEPKGGEILIPSVILLPLLAFDRAGHRLGYGAGYYDATIKNLRKNDHKPLIIGIGFAIQEVDKLPHEAHDERMDMVVTEKGVIRL
jgi:5-formyltetrahydrofolate cyclo-ligase